MKKLFILLLLLHSVLYSQEISTVQSNLTSIENYAINIEQNSIQQQMKIESLEEQLKNAKISQEALENSVIEISAQADKLLKQLKCYERKYKNWKTFAMVMIPLTAITSTGIMSLVLANSSK